jgi:uncharacterized short protein YbdD (DUF466 family)
MIRQTAERMLGVPDYETYVAHLASVHPDRVPPSRDAFFRDRQEARYDSPMRCC